MASESTLAERIRAQREAETLLEEAESQFAADPATAEDTLRALIDKFPETEAAASAKRKLDAGEPTSIAPPAAGRSRWIRAVLTVLFLLPLGPILATLITMSALSVMAFDAGFSWNAMLVVGAIWGATLALGLFMLYLVVRIFL